MRRQAAGTVPQASPLERLWRYRLVFVWAVYLALATAANGAALWLRFDGDIPASVLALTTRMLPWLLVLTSVSFTVFGLHRSLWQFTGMWDLRDLVVAVFVTAAAFYLVVSVGFARPDYPRSVIIMGALLTISLIGGTRLGWRALAEARPRPPGSGKRILIYGAGNAGEMIVRDLNKNLYVPIGFVDDDPAKLGQHIHRVKVLGGRDDLARIVTTETPDEVLVAMPSAGPVAIRHIVSALEQFKVPITTLPPLLEILDGRVTINQVRKLTPEDLLPRMQVHLDVTPAGQLVSGRRVMVTGAGGSIGSELCRQILALGPEQLILYERYENNLYALLNQLEAHPCLRPTIGDVTDAHRLHQVMQECRPHVVFHAAAHKHVPLMEHNPCEAVKNNVVGTRMVVDAAIEVGAERFIQISTDKAVNPSSLMGATKRVAELIVNSRAGGSTRLACVRFGNVLGSNGSVVPRWLEQISAGGPVTVTHPEVRRYFMLIPEAVQLILQAAANTRGGEIFALEMGEQIKLLDMARNLVRLSGFVPDDEIPISFVGLRPGEKLREELVGPGEVVEDSPVEKVLRLRTVNPKPESLMSAVTSLGVAATAGDGYAVVELLRRIVPTFEPGAELLAIARQSVFDTNSPSGRRADTQALRRQYPGATDRANGSPATLTKPSGGATALPKFAALRPAD